MASAAAPPTPPDAPVALPALGGPSAPSVTAELERLGLYGRDAPAPAAAAARRHVDRERDILDDSLETLEASLARAEVDETAIELAGLLVQMGDDESIARAHRVLAECGVPIGVWSIKTSSQVTHSSDDVPPRTQAELSQALDALKRDPRLARERLAQAARPLGGIVERSRPPDAEICRPCAPLSVKDFMRR
ncbi:hypothetical protein M885DRAFT_499711 [Pelagophyceae sp. CCMP2097]|nr:hypothetical protein M885DRAFT_499711 [Pelagophyceae sp. CCMP2097]